MNILCGKLNSFWWSVIAVNERIPVIVFTARADSIDKAPGLHIAKLNE
jgi:hypothetical protein